MIKIAVVGAGKGGKALLDIFHANGGVQVVGITDTDKNAPALRLAKELGIVIANDISGLYSQKPDVVLNVTGNSAITELIRKSSPYPLEVIEGTGAKFLWELVTRQQEARKDMEALYQSGLLITRAKSLADALDEALRSAMRLTDTPAGSIAIIDGEEMVMAAQKGLSSDFLKSLRWKPRGEGITRYILEQTEPVEFQDIEKNPLFHDTVILKEGIKSLLAAPLLLNGSTVGILYLDDFKPRVFTERHKNLIKLFSAMAAQAIEKYKLLHNLEASITYFQGMLDDSGDMIITTDCEGRIVKFSKGGEKILGYKEHEVRGMKCSELYVNKRERTNILELLREKGALCNYETTLLKKNNTPVDISLTISELRDKAGNVIGTVGISKDITEEKRMKSELKKKNKELEELTNNLEEKVLERTNALEKMNRELVRANELKGRFIANASHELRTPLHSIIGFSEILLQKTFGDLTERQQKYLNTIFGSSKHLLYLVNNILDLAKIEAGKAEISYQTFPVKSVIDEVLSVIKPLAERKTIAPELAINYDANFTADKIKFKQILYNLVSNAIKFTPSHGKVGINVDKIASGRKIFPWAAESQEFLKVSVWDKGIGIKPEDRERIFEEFEQIDSSKSTEGTGLGLSLTKKLVEIHGGHIEVEGDIGQGSVFTIYMPFILRDEYPGMTSPITSLTALPEKKQEGPLILVVEDDLPTVEILTVHLTQAGYRIAYAYDGEEALLKAKELNPFAITLDIMLPKKDGWEVLQSLKANPETRNIPVIIHSIVENKELAFALGATDYLVKPVERAMLIEKLSEMSFVTKKSRFHINILVITSDETTLEILHNAIENEGLLMQSASDIESGLSLALATKPNSIIIDLGIHEKGFKIIKEFQENPALKDIPIFAIATETLSPNERLEMVDQIERVLWKESLGTKSFINHLKDIEILHPKRAGLVDELTGIFNHRYFQIRLVQETLRADRYKLPLALMLFDIDHFENYIAQKGEYYGNLVIKKTAELIKKNIRGSDIFVRYGNSSFALLLTNTLMPPATRLAKRFVSVIHDYPFLHEEVQPGGKITISLGLVEFQSQTPEELIYAAESSLSAAVAKGRNRTEVYQRSKTT
ncbi:MAG: diguanylate cyclase [Planctomycetes bacterium]|nr:diguanylate cyclase [Planctomycetota bacterium]